ncbi:peritrophin-48 [Eurosta solidaginis]|uniref:peritrophin-48 n=1 Tax=Eurosta solidaginis TaxID=178769 RepID=UPI003530E9CA
MFFKKSPRNIFALALILLGSCADAALDVNMNHICLLLTNSALIASGDSCTSYYSCYNGVATLQYCSGGTYFDKNSQACVSQAPAYCSTPNSDPCVGHNVGTFVAVPGSCAGFYYCSTTGAQRSNCPNNLVFNPTKQACDFSSIYLCDESTNTNVVDKTVVNLCSFVQNHVYIGNAFSCSAWQICNNDNSFTTGTCGNGLVFDTKQVLCNYPTAVECSQVTYDPSLDVTAAASGGTCTTNGAIKKATACNQYYLCNGMTWVLKNCIGNLFFDTKTLQCVNRLNAYNDCDRCVSTTDSFVNSFGTNCTGYSFCSHGVQQSPGTCPTGMFFNEVLEGCTDDNPEFAFCAEVGSSAGSQSTTTSTPTTTEESTTSTPTTTEGSTTSTPTTTEESTTSTPTTTEGSTTSTPTTTERSTT